MALASKRYVDRMTARGPEHPRRLAPPIEKIYHRFRPIKSATSAETVDIAAGSWTRNGITVTSAETSSIGTSTNYYIIATLDDADTPTTLTVTAAAAVPTADEQDTKRLICTLTYTDGTITKITRNQLSDIQDQVTLIQAADDSWSDGGNETGVSWDVITAIQYSSPNFQYKKRILTIVNGRTKVGKEGDWITFATAEVCP